MTVTRTVLREQIKDALIERILTGYYQPGDRLVETQIAQEFGTSQAPVRESLRDLESLRFVESQPFRGTRVRAFTRQELAEMYPVRAALEGLAGELAARALQAGEAPALLTDLRRAYDAMLEASLANDPHVQVAHDVEFHALIVKAAGNNTLFEVWSSLRVETRTFITAMRTHLGLQFITETHLPIIDALATGDPYVAGRAIAGHINWFGEQLLQGDDL